ncbi:hypothetical protein [Pimelobacter simplex]|uniref:hypothetical protein n=1 Tax=Nocardioides simplex TaxID=2045 RepID=UPI00215047F6|nr:hypothetical protein [Pimelobacter simplex]UUW92674.1 hypothetical protein M0M43_14680 [Pimelobacter simplex]UUW96502.1 hypothetical protein M0M48_03315 [Pimelobacter simplex]
MTTTPAEPLFPWLPPARVLRWLGLTDSDEAAAIAEDCRRAAAAWCETQRPDLIDADTGVFSVSDAIVQAGVMAAARLYIRKGSGAGLPAYAELGAGDVLRLDPDVARLLGIGVYAPPRIG